MQDIIEFFEATDYILAENTKYVNTLYYKALLGYTSYLAIQGIPSNSRYV
jgi:hypothetical protein